MPLKFTACTLAHLIGILVLPVSGAAPNFLELSRTQATGSVIQSSASSLPSQETPVQKAIPASLESIALGGFKFRVAEVAFDETAMGFVPVGLSEGDLMMFVEFELKEGDKNAFKSLEITVSCASGRKSKAVILTSDGIMQMLATVTLRNSTSAHKPGRDNITFVYVVPKDADGLHLYFPTGETIDLAPLIK
jgi:hypothetical protein